MEWLPDLPVWALALLVFAVRIIDVSLGTLRTICVVQGRIGLSVVLGFFEVLIWIIAVSQVINSVSEHPILVVTYAGGFAAGNAVGICLERYFALGSVVVRIISGASHGDIAAALREHTFRVTTLLGEGRDGPVHLIFVTCQRRDLPKVLGVAKSFNPRVFFTVEPVQQHRELLTEVLPYPTGWRAFFKMK